MVLVVLAIALVGGIGPAATYFFWARDAQQRRAAANAAQHAKRNAKSRRTLVAAKDRWVDVVKPSNGKAEPQEIQPKTTRRKHQTMRRTGTQTMHRTGRRSAHRADRRARPTARVPITMYMAHW